MTLIKVTKNTGNMDQLWRKRGKGKKATATKTDLADAESAEGCSLVHQAY